MQWGQQSMIKKLMYYIELTAVVPSETLRWNATTKEFKFSLKSQFETTSKIRPPHNRGQFPATPKLHFQCYMTTSETRPLCYSPIWVILDLRFHCACSRLRPGVKITI